VTPQRRDITTGKLEMLFATVGGPIDSSLLGGTSTSAGTAFCKMISGSTIVKAGAVDFSSKHPLARFDFGDKADLCFELVCEDPQTKRSLFLNRPTTKYCVKPVESEVEVEELDCNGNG